LKEYAKETKVPRLQKKVDPGRAANALQMQENVLHQASSRCKPRLHLQLHRFDKRKIEREHARRQLQQSDCRVKKNTFF
jgi:hypothetical protein